MDNAISIRDAAIVAEVTEKTIRRWIKSGRLPAVKLGGQYHIVAADLETAMAAGPDGDVQGGRPVSPHRVDTGQDSPPVDMSDRVDSTHGQGRQPEPVDLEPLAALIDDLTRRNADLAAAAAMWQTRAAYLENELKQLTAGEAQAEADDQEPELATVAPGSPESAATTPAGRSWWRRLLGV